MLLGTKGIAARSKDAPRLEAIAIGNKKEYRILPHLCFGKGGFSRPGANPSVGRAHGMHRREGASSDYDEKGQENKDKTRKKAMSQKKQMF